MDLRHALDTTYYHNSLSLWLIALAIMIGGVLALLVMRRFVIRRLSRLAKRTKTDADDLAVDLLRRTRWFFLVLLASWASSHVLVLPVGWQQTVRLVTVFALALQGGIWGHGIIGFWVDRYAGLRVDRDGATATTVIAIGYLGRFVLWVVILLLVLDNLEIRVTSLVTGLGIGGIAVALAVQNVLGDLFGAMSIVLDKPFVVGDAIAVDQLDGTVEHIGLKTTRLRSSSGEQIIISNADLLRSRIRNFKRMEERRVVLSIAIAAETPADVAEKVPAMLREIVIAQPMVRFDRSHFQRYGPAGLEFETVYFVTTPAYMTFMDAQQAINLELLRRFQSERIAVARPASTVTLVHADGATSPTSVAARP